MVNVDSTIASDAIGKAGTVQDKDAPHKVLEAQKEMQMAADELSKGHYDHAIDHYKNAWKKVEDALKGKTPVLYVHNREWNPKDTGIPKRQACKGRDHNTQLGTDITRHRIQDTSRKKRWKKVPSNKQDKPRHTGCTAAKVCIETLCSASIDTQLLMAESRRKIAHDFRVFFMGRKGSMEAKYTTNKGLLPDALIDEMRQAFRRSQELLDLETQSNYTIPSEYENATK